MDTLRAQVLDNDIEQFDKLTANARTSIMDAIKEYLGKGYNTWQYEIFLISLVPKVHFARSFAFVKNMQLRSTEHLF